MQIKTLRFNAYSNRECIGYDTLSSYDRYVVDTFDGVDFKPGDGVNTEIILNITTAHSNIDYLLAVEDGLDIINSRWFILDCTRLRNGQYKLSLYRDTLYDYKSEIANSTAYIKRGWITSTENPLIFNQEDFQTNQILTRVDTLQQGSHGAWVVGYLSPNAEGNQLSYIDYFNGKVLTEAEFANIYPFAEQTPDAPASFEGTLIGSPLNDSITLRLPSKRTDANGNYYTANVKNGTCTRFLPELGWETGNWTPKGESVAEVEAQVTSIASGLLNDCYSGWRSALGAALVNSRPENVPRYSKYSSWNDQTVCFRNTFYHVSIAEKNDTTPASTDLNNFNIKTTIKTYLNAQERCVESPNIIADDIKGRITGDLKQYTIVFEREDRAGTYNARIPEPVQRPIGLSQPYNIFAIPCGQEVLRGSDATVTTNATTAKEIALSIAQEFSKMYTGSGALYDLQLLPYCPIRYNSSGQVQPSSISWITNSSGTKVSGICWVKDTEIRGYAALDLTWGNPVTPTDTALNLKMINQLYSCRIVAPNHGSMYEFNPARLGNKNSTQSALSLVSVSLTYKPYAPLIFIKPKTWANGLYGQTYDSDTRGLICAGDFSLPQSNDAWQTYQINNKNYLNAFDRQIESVELNNKYAKRNDIAGAIAGAVSAAVSSGITGAAVGGPIGAGVGAIAGGLVSGVAGAVDAGTNEKLRADQLDLKRDMFNFDLQNIQAQPQTITKVGAYDVLNSIFPVVETYCASNEEEAAFRQYLKYNGMKIGVISTLSNYKVSHRFISADIININLHEDTHLINTIRDEVSKGFYDGRITNI